MVIKFILMYSHSYRIFAYAWFSRTRLFMMLFMVGAMVMVMLAFVHEMYRSDAAHIAILLGATVHIPLSIWPVRSQATVMRIDHMEGLIPHHSIAILTSERARIEDLRVRELADGITDAQRREITEMERPISDMRANGPATTRAEADSRPVPFFSGEPD